MIDANQQGPSSPEQNRGIPAQPWTDEIEAKLLEHLDMVKEKAAQHEKAGYAFKRKRLFFALPAVLLPAIMTPISSLISDESWSKYVNAPAFALTSFFSVITSFFKFGEMKESHFQFSTKYTDIAIDIETEMTKNRKYRKHVEVLLTELNVKMKNLNNRAPVIPKNILDNIPVIKKKDKGNNRLSPNNDINLNRSLDNIIQHCYSNGSNSSNSNNGNNDGNYQNLSTPNPQVNERSIEQHSRTITNIYDANPAQTNYLTSPTPRHTPLTGESDRVRLNFY